MNPDILAVSFLHTPCPVRGRGRRRSRGKIPEADMARIGNEISGGPSRPKAAAQRKFSAA